MPAAPVLYEVLTGEQSEIYGDLPLLPLPGDDELLLRFAQTLLQVVKEESLYRRDSVVVYPYQQAKRLEQMEPTTFRSWVENFCVCYKRRYDNAGDPFQVLRTMPKDIADGVLACTDFWQGLREIVQCNACPQPVINEAGETVWLAEGYDAESKTLTFPF